MPYRPNFPIPENIDAELMCLQLMIPNDPTWKSVVAGLLYELQYWFNWQRDNAESGRQCAAIWKQIYLDIDWSNMSCCCDDPIPVQYRYTDDSILQRSTDGGVTWVDAPEYDSRNYSPQFPAPVGEDIPDLKCIAATSAMVLISEQIGNELSEDMSRYTLDELIKDWIGTYLTTSDPLLMLLTVAANQIFALGIALIIPALTEEVYEQFKCILYCNMSNDISFDNTSWSEVRSQTQSEISGIAGLFLQHLVYVLGAGGLTNVIRAGGAVEGNCEECECGEFLRVYVTPGGVGTEVSWEDDILTAEAQLAGSRYELFVQLTSGATDFDVCGYIKPFDGTPGITWYSTNSWHCGETSPTPVVSFGDFQTTYSAVIAMSSNDPFTMKFQAKNSSWV